MNIKDYIVINPKVQAALNSNKPVVALESTIISHGMPYPKNVETALNVEKIVRENGAVPATIAIIKGKITVGITEEEIIEIFTHCIPYVGFPRVLNAITSAKEVFESRNHASA